MSVLSCAAMTPTVTALVLSSALLHASWNALLRSGTDRLWSLAVMTASASLVASPFALLLPAPARDSWPLLALSASLQLAYGFLLVRAYRHGALGQVYPIARGLSPVLVALFAALVAGEQLSARAWLGIALVSCGIFGSAFGRGRLDPGSLAAALATGVFIAAYTVTDGIGARASQHATSYAAWLFVAHGSCTSLAYLAIRRSLPPSPVGPETFKAALGGIVSMIAYGIVVWAMSQSPMGAVSALRETSILFAVIIARIFLGEPLTPARILSVLAIAAGAICL